LRLVRDGREVEVVDVKERNGETLVLARESKSDYLVYAEREWEAIT
jgi:hypothetical protein